MAPSSRKATSAPGVYSRELKSGLRVYDITYTVVTASGRKKKWESGFASAKAARARREEALVSIRRGTYVMSSQQPLGEYIERRLNERFQAGAIRESTWSDDLRLVRNHLPVPIARLPIQALTTSHLNDLYARLARDGRKDSRTGGLSPRTIERLHILISQTLKYAVAQGLVAQNVATSAYRPRRNKKDIAALTLEDVSRYLKAAQEDWFFALFALALTTGMRRGELCGLTWDCVHLDQAEVEIRKTLIAINHRPVWSAPKTAKGHRTISIDPRTVEILREQRRKVAEAKLLLGTGWKDRFDLVFPNPDGTLYNPEVISMRHSRLIAKAGLKPTSLHALRHTYATLAVRQGMNIKALSERLGHSTVHITMDTYQHIPQDFAREAADALAEYIFGNA